MRIMGVDYGDVRIGLAVSDEMNILVGDAWTLTERNADLAAEKIADEVQKRSVQRIVLGLPKNMDGSEGSRAEKCRLFAQKLEEKTGLCPVLWDERRSSIEAHAILHANGRREKNHRKNVDAVAASHILEGYLRSL